MMDNEVTESSEKLWSLLDDIDTYSDMIKPTNESGYKAFFEATMKKVAERFNVHSSDGYALSPVANSRPKEES